MPPQRKENNSRWSNNGEMITRPPRPLPLPLPSVLILCLTEYILNGWLCDRMAWELEATIYICMSRSGMCSGHISCVTLKKLQLVVINPALHADSETIASSTVKDGGEESKLWILTPIFIRVRGQADVRLHRCLLAWLAGYLHRGGHVVAYCGCCRPLGVSEPSPSPKLRKEIQSWETRGRDFIIKAIWSDTHLIYRICCSARGVNLSPAGDTGGLGAPS